MAATTKSDLIAITTKEFAKLSKLIATCDAPTALHKHDGDTSIKDVVAHRAHWIDLFFGWYGDGQAGHPVYFPAAGYNWNDLMRYNASLRASHADMDWPAAQKYLQINSKTLLNFIQNHSESDLYAAPMKGANNAWTTGRWIEAAGPSHFHSAAKFIRVTLKALPPIARNDPNT